MINLFKEKYYFPDFQNLIQNIINECSVCNIAKTENRNKKLTFEITPETFQIREKYVMDFYMIDNLQLLSCIDICSKFATLVEVKSRDWLEAKKAIIKVFTEMGKENVKLEITTSKNCISDVERFHKTVNEKLRIINSENDIEYKLIKFDKILYI